MGIVTSLLAQVIMILPSVLVLVGSNPSQDKKSWNEYCLLPIETRCYLGYYWIYLKKPAEIQWMIPNTGLIHITLNVKGSRYFYLGVELTSLFLYSTTLVLSAFIGKLITLHILYEELKTSSLDQYLQVRSFLFVLLFNLLWILLSLYTRYDMHQVF